MPGSLANGAEFQHVAHSALCLEIAGLCLVLAYITNQPKDAQFLGQREATWTPRPSVFGHYRNYRCYRYYRCYRCHHCSLLLAFLSLLVTLTSDDSSQGTIVDGRRGFCVTA